MNKETLTKISALICEHLIQQKSQSMNERQACKLRGDEGKMCSVGCLIDDDYYQRAMEDCMDNIVTQTPHAGDRALRDAVLLSLRDRGLQDVLWTSELASLLSYWQDYHDAATTNGLRYIKWIIGDQSEQDHSPLAAHLQVCYRFN